MLVTWSNTLSPTLRFGCSAAVWPLRRRCDNAAMTDEADPTRRAYEGIPVVGGLLRRQRREAERAISSLAAALMRDNIGLDMIVRRLDIDAIVARLDIGEIVARLDIDAIVARLDIDAIVARLDMNEVVARIDFPKLANQIVDDVKLPKVLRQASSSVVRTRRPRKAPDSAQ